MYYQDHIKVNDKAESLPSNFEGLIIMTSDKDVRIPKYSAGIINNSKYPF